MSDLAVVVPAYRATLDAPERASLTQSLQVLQGAARIALVPHALARAAPAWLGEFDRVEAFDDAFFTSRESYNRLMLDPSLYARFSAYASILICQLDVWIFRNELAHWATRGYDYIGAPWIRDLSGSFAPALHQRAYECLGEATRLAGLRDRHGAPHKWQLRFRTGNGGLSLRRVAGFERVLRDFAPLRERALARLPGGHARANEDVFFSLMVNQGRPALRIPSAREAAYFSLENYVAWGLQMTQGQMPFGCHKWFKFRDQWQRHAPQAPFLAHC